MMLVRKTCAAVLAAAGWLAAAAAAPADKQTLTHETLWLMPRLTAPVVSPDGRQVVYALLEPAYDPDKAVSDLWLVPTDGRTPPRRITHSKAPEEGVAWSPDSRSLIFASKRDGDEAPQIYRLDLAEGGEAQRLTDLSTGASNPQWRPDGKAILFESLVYPGAADDQANRQAAAEVKARKSNVRVYEQFPVRHWNQWLDERRPTILVQSLAPGAKPVDLLVGSSLAAGSGFAGAPASESNFSLAPLWSPDGAEVIFTATTGRDQAASAPVAYQLYHVAAGGGAAPQALATEAGNFEEIRFSPDGKALFFKYAPEDALEVYHQPRLTRLGWPITGNAIPVTPGFDHELAHYALSADGRQAYLLVPEAGRQNLYQVPTAGGRPTPVLTPDSGGYTTLSIADKAPTPVLIASYGSSISPAEVVRVEPERRRHVALTQVNRATAAGIDWQPPQHFTFTSSKGRSIHSMVVLPPGFDPAKKYPAIVFIHGGAAAFNADQIGLRWNYHLLAAPGYVVLMTDYTGSTSFGEAFAQAIKGDPLKTPGEDIDQAVDQALQRYPFIDGTRLCAAGASYGGHLANWIEATATRYRCIISHAGEVDLTSQWGTSDSIYNRELTNGGPPWQGNPVWHDQSPLTYAAEWRTPILLSIGEKDFRVPLNNTLENWSTLQRLHIPSRLLVWPDAGHWITKPEDSRRFYQEVEAWLGKWLNR